jgi:hypothetical protein
MEDLAIVLDAAGYHQDERGGWHGAKESPVIINNARPAPQKHNTADHAHLIERARRYVAKMPASIDSQGGHDALWAVAQVLIRGFTLTISEAWPLLLEFNGRCRGPWSEKDLRHKLEQAESKSRKSWGYMIGRARPEQSQDDSQTYAVNGDGHGGDREPDAGTLSKGDAYEGPDAEPSEPDSQEQPQPYRLALISSPTFEATDYRREWLVRKILVRGQPCILGGPKKSLKTSIIVDLALSLATATPFLGGFPVPRKVRVAVLSGESGDATLQCLARRVARARGLPWPQVDAFWGFDLPQLSIPSHLVALGKALAEHRPEVFIYDPLYLGLLAGQGGDGSAAASNIYAMGPLLLTVARTCLELGATPILCHHFKLTRKEPYSEPQLEDLAYSGVQEFARQWILVSRRSPFNPDHPEGLHELWLQAGGSVGHGVLRALDIREGKLLDDFSGQIWDVKVSGASDARTAEADHKTRERERHRQARDRADETKILAALDEMDPDRCGVTFTKLRGQTRLSTDRARWACDRLTGEGALQEAALEVTSGNGTKTKARGYRRPPVEQGQEDGQPSTTEGDLYDGQHGEYPQ